MLAQAGRVLVEFRFSDTGALPKAIRRHDPNTETAREKRFEQQKGRPILERTCAVPASVQMVLEQMNMRLVDARFVDEVSKKKWKIFKRVRFTFERVPADSPQPSVDIAGALATLEWLAEKRWSISRVAFVHWDVGCITMYFDNELEHPADPMDLDDPLAASFGLRISKAKPKVREIDSTATQEQGA